MSRRRRNVERHAGDFVYENLAGAVERMMDNRHRLLAPFPLEPNDLYQYYWTTREWEALQVLQDVPELVRTDRTLVLTAVIEGKASGKNILATINTSMDEHRARVKGPLDINELPVEWQEKLREWMPLWTKLDADTKKLVRKIKDTATVCKTYGQVARLWPDLEGFFPAWGRQKLNNAKVRSAIPERALEWSRNEDGSQYAELQEKFRPEAFVPYAEMIAECIMLPNTPCTHVARVSMRYV
jgi:hypothetical protein